MPNAACTAIVTGSSGRIGAAIVPLLLRDGFDVVGIDRRPAITTNRVASIQEALPALPLADAIVMHFAGNPDENCTWAEAEEDNLLPSIAMLSAATRRGAACLVLASSQWAERDPDRPYGRSKLLIEEIARTYRGTSRTDIIVDRIGYFPCPVTPNPPSEMSWEQAIKVTPEQLYARIMSRSSVSKRTGLRERH